MVRDEVVGRSIEMPGVNFDPEKFTDEPVFARPRWIGHHFY
jgi:hypothetical protein